MLNPPMDIESMIRADINRLRARSERPDVAGNADALRATTAQLHAAEDALTVFLQKKARR